MNHPFFPAWRAARMNPVDALLNANYMGILAWAIALGLALKHGSQGSRDLLTDMANAVSSLVRLVIRFAPLGIFGLVAVTIAESGFDALRQYGLLLIVLTTWLGIYPGVGYIFRGPRMQLQYLLLPMIALAARPLSIIARITRAARSSTRPVRS